VDAWVPVAEVKELERRRRKVVTVGDTDIALFSVEGQIYALHDVCIHKQRRLHKGTILKGRAICPGHQWAFDLRTGWVDEQDQCLPTYEVKVEDDKVYVNPEPRIRTSPPPPEERWQPS
jgi:nitrite reductase/ring-hydroxylating ferredoxin subunit